MERKGKNRKVALGCCGVMAVGAAGCVALSVFVLWPPIPLSMQGYVDQFDRTGRLDLRETDPINITINPLVEIRKDEPLNRKGENGALICIREDATGTEVFRARADEWEGMLSDPENKLRKQDWRCFRRKEHFKTRLIEVTKSFTGEVTLIEGDSYWSVMFASGPLFCERIFVDGKLVESQNFRMSD